MSCGAGVMVRIVNYRHYAPPALGCETIIPHDLLFPHSSVICVWTSPVSLLGLLWRKFKLQPIENILMQQVISR
jgi:hypothetical protein